MHIPRQKNELKPKDITRRDKGQSSLPLWVEDLRAMAIGPGAEGYSHTLCSLQQLSDISMGALSPVKAVDL